MSRPIAGPAELPPLLLLFPLLLFACAPPRDEPSPGPALAGDRSFTFGTIEPGRTPPEFTVVAGDWRVQPDPESQEIVLAQLAASAGPVFNLILAPGAMPADLEVEARVCALSGGTDRGGGLVWRARDGANYYLCRWNPLESNFRLYRVIEGDRIQMASSEATAEGGWHEIRATMSGGRIECRFDGELLLTAEDGALTGPGRVGLWTKADAVTLFDGLRVTPR